MLTKTRALAIIALVTVIAGTAVTLMPSFAISSRPPIGYQGSVATSGNSYFTWGWTCDPDVPGRSIQVHFYIDGPAGRGGKLAGVVTANGHRPDVRSYCGGTANHGFRWTVPARFRTAGTHTVYAYAIDPARTGNPLLGGSPKSYTVEPAFSWTRQFLVGGFGAPPPFFLNASRMNEMKQAGLNFIVADRDRAYNLKLLRLASERGIDVAFIDPAFTGHPNLNQSAAAVALQPYLQAVGSDAICCWVLRDEPDVTLFSGIRATAQSLALADSFHPSAVNIYPAYAGAAALGAASYEQYVARYVNEVGLGHLMVDTYPYFRNEAALPGRLQQHYKTLEVTSKYADSRRIPLHVWVQSIESAGDIFFDKARLRVGVATSIAYGAKGIFYFTYWSPPAAIPAQPLNAMIKPDGTRGWLFDAVKDVNGELQAIGNFLMQLTHKGTFHQSTRGFYSGTRLIRSDPENALIQSLGNDYALAGFFKHGDGRDVVVIANKNVERGFNRTRVVFKTKICKAWTLSRVQGLLLPLPVSGGNTIYVDLPAGWMSIVVAESAAGACNKAR